VVLILSGLMLQESWVFLSTLPADRRQRLLAITAVLVSAALFGAVLPFAREPLAPVPAFLPIYQSALVAFDLITAILLFGQFCILRSRALLVLGGAYLFSALMAICHALSFPGLFSPGGLLGSGPQTTAWLYFFWHGGFAAAVIAYALLRDEPAMPVNKGAGAAIATGVAVTLAAAVALMLLATAGHGALPVLMSGDGDHPAKYVVAWITWLATLGALPLLGRRRPLSVLDLWLMVVICAWLFDVALAAVFNAGRYSVGWYAGRVYGLAAATFVLSVLLLENTGLHARLVRALGGERDERRRVQETTSELNELNASLERRIAQRTAELEASNRELRQEAAEHRRAEQALQRSREELHELASVGATAREQEKSRIARELHDELAQSLTALKMDVGWIENHGPVFDQALASKVAAMHRLLDETVSATRRIASDLRPLMLDDLGLVAAAQWLAESFQKRHGIECRLSIEPPEIDLPDPQATAVFRIMQEALANAAKHAHASRIEIELRAQDGEIRLRVHDDGRGFDAAAPRKPTSFGIVGLRERAHLVGGRIAIDTAPGHGTTIEVSIPLRRAG